MSDSFFDADRAGGEYPPKGWGWKDTAAQRDILQKHFDKGGDIDPWMTREAARLGCTVRKEAAKPMPGETDVPVPDDKDMELRIWTAVRRDLEIPIGKLSAQTGHAFVGALWAAPRDVAEAYMSEAGQAKVTVRVKNEAELVKMYEACRDAGLPTVIVKDAGRTVFSEPTLTTMGVGPCRAVDLPKKFRRLQLL